MPTSWQTNHQRMSSARAKIPLLGMMLAAWMLISAPASAQDLGALLRLQTTRCYASITPRESFIWLRPLKELTVETLHIDKQAALWYQVRVNRSRPRKTTGWALANPAAQDPGDSSNQAAHVRVWKEPPTTELAIAEGVNVPRPRVTFLEETRADPAQPLILWQRVRYQNPQPRRCWMPASKSIYRADLNAKEFIQLYSELRAEKLPTPLLKRLLQGLIRTGDTSRQVLWALGKPLYVQEYVNHNRA